MYVVKATSIFVILLACRICAAGTGDVLRCIADIQRALDSGRADSPYEVTAQVIYPGIPGKYSFTASDATGSLNFGVNPAATSQCPTNAGDIIRICGRTVSVAVSKQKAPPDIRRFGADSTRIERIGHSAPPEPLDVSGTEFYSRAELRNRLVRIRGTVHDTFMDEIDPKFAFLVLTCDATAVYMAVLAESMPKDRMDSLVGSTVSAVGIATDEDPGCRTWLGRILTASSADAISVISSKDVASLSVPELDHSLMPGMARPQNIARRKVTGHVIAVWSGGERMLLRTANGDLVRADLKFRQPPRYGDHVEAVGFPETDLYRMNLSDAVWCAKPGPPFVEDEAMPVTTDGLWMNQKGQPYKNAWFHGYAVRLRGMVRSLPDSVDGNGRMYLESGRFTVPVDATSCPSAFDGVTAGCTVEVTGTYITEIDAWRPSRVFPHVRNILIVVRRPQDVKVVAHPPWWTPGRLMTLIGVLVSVIFGIAVWNVALHRRAELRGNELAAEQLDNVTSRLKVYERTHLAVDLHDSLSQTLTGVSMGIGSAMDSIGAGETALRQRLGLVARMVEACRTELRNCLWDLRNQALEEESMERAIRLSLAQILDRTSLHVRFNVPRARLSDNTAHAILRIVRELAANAIRHGRASSIWIAGSIENGMLRFSVRDDGVGFDPALAPGVAEGHFGLQGIRERIERFEGHLKVASRPGEGTKVTVAISVPPEMPTEEDSNA